MAKSIPLPSEEIKQSLRYEPETGKLFWLVANNNRIKVGDETGCADNSGYLQVRLNRKIYFAHRIIWLLVHGKDPGSLHIDHINGDKADNRIENLRLATDSNNKHNMPKLSNNKSGYKGVYWNKASSKWHTQIMINKKQIHLGYFDNIKDAAAAYAAAAKKYHGEFAKIE